MRSLIVEDDFTTRTVLARLLGEFGPTDVAVNGLEALEAIEKAHEARAPYDFATFDLNMPEMDGLAALHELRNRETSRGVAFMKGLKILIISGREDFASVATAFRAGCEAYLIKPIDRNTLYPKLRELGLIT